MVIRRMARIQDSLTFHIQENDYFGTPAAAWPSHPNQSAP
jgi:hypothetical protein